MSAAWAGCEYRGKEDVFYVRSQYFIVNSSVSLLLAGFFFTNVFLGGGMGGGRSENIFIVSSVCVISKEAF